MHLGTSGTCSTCPAEIYYPTKDHSGNVSLRDFGSSHILDPEKFLGAVDMYVSGIMVIKYFNEFGWLMTQQVFRYLNSSV
jgi:hypothetical protein